MRGARIRAKVVCSSPVRWSMAATVAAFSDRRTTFAANSQIPKRTAAVPLTPVSAAVGIFDAGAGDAPEPLDAVLADGGAEAAGTAFAADGAVTAIASICAANALALKPVVSLWLENVVIVARRLSLALIKSSSPCSSEIFASSTVL